MSLPRDYFLCRSLTESMPFLCVTWPYTFPALEFELFLNFTSFLKYTRAHNGSVSLSLLSGINCKFSRLNFLSVLRFVAKPRGTTANSDTGHLILWIQIHGGGLDFWSWPYIRSRTTTSILMWEKFDVRFINCCYFSPILLLKPVDAIASRFMRKLVFESEDYSFLVFQF